MAKAADHLTEIAIESENNKFLLEVETLQDALINEGAVRFGGFVASQRKKYTIVETTFSLQLYKGNVYDLMSGADFQLSSNGKKAEVIFPPATGLSRKQTIVLATKYTPYLINKTVDPSLSKMGFSFASGIVSFDMNHIQDVFNINDGFKATPI